MGSDINDVRSSLYGRKIDPLGCRCGGATKLSTGSISYPRYRRRPGQGCSTRQSQWLARWPGPARLPWAWCITFGIALVGRSAIIATSETSSSRHNTVGQELAAS